ncbi:MAG TPA: hypothetical protein VI299_16510 [Polyangiales bacterium]
MKKLAVVLSVVVIALATYSVYQLQRYHDSNENPRSEMPGDIGAAPEFYVSDNKLLQPGQRAVRAQLEPKDGWGAEASYFIQFDDGRYVWGMHVDAETGLTREVHSDASYQVFWGDEAQERWLRRHPMGRL